LSATFGSSNFRPPWKKCQAKVPVERYRLDQAIAGKTDLN